LKKWNIKPYSCLAAKHGKLSFEILARKKIVGMEMAASEMILKSPSINNLFRRSPIGMPLLSITCSLQTPFFASNPGIYGSGVIHLVSTKTRNSLGGSPIGGWLVRWKHHDDTDATFRANT
jgi:hypothetical protein